MMNKKNILVTGGVGYIGSHACVELLNNNYNVIIIDNLTNSNKNTLDKIEEITQKKVIFFEADIRDKVILRNLFKQYPIDAVMHFAGLKAVGESCEKPLMYYQNNINGTLVLIEVMLEFGVKKLVFSSSATVYGDSKKIPYIESLPICPTNPYGRTKAMIEQILADLAQSNPQASWNIVVLRYFNPIGAHESGLIGELPNGIPNNLVPYITQVASGKLKQLSIFGNDYSTIDGTGVRDYIHIVDLVKGHLKALETLDKPMKTKNYQVYNLGCGTGYSVLELIHAFEKITACKINYKIARRRAGDIAESVANTNLAKQALNWQTEKTLEDMIKDSWRWQQNVDK